MASDEIRGIQGSTAVDIMVASKQRMEEIKRDYKKDPRLQMVVAENSWGSGS